MFCNPRRITLIEKKLPFEIQVVDLNNKVGPQPPTTGGGFHGGAPSGGRLWLQAHRGEPVWGVVRSSPERCDRWTCLWTHPCHSLAGARPEPGLPERIFEEAGVFWARGRLFVRYFCE
jgi:hypothetical protein